MRDAIHRRLARLCVDRPLLVLGLALALAVVSVLAATSKLKVNADTDDLIGEDRPWMGTYRAFLEEFGDLENIYAVVVDPGDPARTAKAFDALQRRVEAELGADAVLGRVEPEDQLKLAPHAMSTPELLDLARAASAFSLWREVGADPSTLIRRANESLLRAANPTLSEAEREASAASGVLTFKALAAAVEDTAAAKELGPLVLPRPAEYKKSETGRLWFLEIVPRKDYGTLAVIEEPLRKIRKAIDATKAEHPGIEIGLTGKPVLQADEMVTTDADMTRAAIIGIILVGLCFMLIMREIVRPALAVIALLVGIAWTFGWATIAVGQLNLLSMVFTLVLVGVGIDFGVHFVARYRKARELSSLEDALTETMIVTGRGNLTGALTSSVAFLASAFTDFRGLQELGVIAGGGIALCLLAMATVLPAALVLVDRRGTLGTLRPTTDRPWWPGRHPRTIAAIGICLSLPAIPAFIDKKFDENVLDLQAQNLESVRWEHRILEDSAAASWFGAVIADDRAEVEALHDRAMSQRSIGMVRSIKDITPPDDAERAAARAAIAAASNVPQIADGTPKAQTAEETLAQLARAERSFSALAALAREVDRAAADDLARTGADLARVRQALASDETLWPKLKAHAAAVHATLGLIGAGAALPLREALPRVFRDRFIAKTGRFLVSFHPRDNVWDTTQMRRFVATMREIDPGVTGVPITHLESIDDMKRGFLRAALLALAMVVVLVALDFRSLQHTFLALTPLLFSAAWLAAAMDWLGLSFNLANFFAVPILIGIGVDAGIHLIHRHREDHGALQRFGPTHRAVMLTALTSLIGFGALNFAEHRGLASLGAVMALGCTAQLVASLLLVPAFLNLRRPRAEAAAKTTSP